MLSNDGLRDGMQVSRSIVITEALPCVEHVVFGRATKRRKTGKAAEPLIVVGNHGRNLCLLKHELGNEDCVRITRSAPWQVAAMAAVPFDQCAAKLSFPERHR